MSLPIEPFTFIVLMLAAWRLAYMLTLEEGPYKVFFHLREKLPHGGLLNCIYCTSVWTAAAMLLLWTIAPVLVWVFAISAGSLLADRIISS